MLTVHILWFAYRSISSLKPRSDALISTRVNSVHWGGGGVKFQYKGIYKRAAGRGILLKPQSI